MVLQLNCATFAEELGLVLIGVSVVTTVPC
jgi:hypothetical protein